MAPEAMKPMLLHNADDSTVFSNKWAFEIKFDGVRAILHVTDGGVNTVTTRRGVDITAQFPEVSAHRILGSLTLDGEIVGLTGEGGFHKLNYVQRRLGITDPAKLRHRMLQYPVRFMAFDLLQINGQDCRDYSWAARRMTLEAVHIKMTTYFDLSPVYEYENLHEMWAWVQDQRMEGLVAKRKDSKYLSGRRSRDWLKIKHRLPVRA
jgi:bifunctional non-homologous end joining protein LigD